MTWRKKLKGVPLIAKANAAFRSYQQEGMAARGLADYRRRATEMGITCPTGDALREAVGKRLASTGRRVAPKPKGDLHLFVAYGIDNWEQILPRSVEPFGQVSQYEWRSHGFKFTGPVAQWLATRDEMNRQMLQAFRDANARRPVDVVCAYVSGYTASPEMLREMAAAGAVILNFCYDDKVYFPGKKVGGRYTSPAAIADVVDLNLTNAPDCVVKYAVHGGLAMFWPEAAHPDFHHPYDVPFEFDVVFPGTCYGWRPKFVNRLRELGINAQGFGRGWANGPLSDEELVRLYSRSRIVLGSGGIGHSQRLMCLKGRDFEVPMSGGLYLTSDNPELRLVFDVGREIVTFRDADDCARIIRHLLDHPDEAAAIRAAGRKRALSDHTYEARWAEALRTANLLA